MLQNSATTNNMMTLSSRIIFALLALCEGKPPVTGGFPSQRPVTRGFDVFFDLRLNKRSNKQSRRRWFEPPSRPLWRHCNATTESFTYIMGCIASVIWKFKHIILARCHMTTLMVSRLDDTILSNSNSCGPTPLLLWGLNKMAVIFADNLNTFCRKKKWSFYWYFVVVCKGVIFHISAFV